MIIEPIPEFLKIYMRVTDEANWPELLVPEILSLQMFSVLRLCTWLARVILNWLQSPVTKYFSHNPVCQSTKIKPKKYYHDYKGWSLESLVTSLYSNDITLVLY